MPELYRGLTRFAADLPRVDRFVSLGEGGTPLLPLERIAGRIGVAELHAKMESYNPTGSYKDRVAAMSISLAVSRDHAGWIATSSGNAGNSFAAFGAKAGMPGFLCIVSTAPAEKIAAVNPYNVFVLPVEGIGSGGTPGALQELFGRVEEASCRHNLFLGVTANSLNPDGMRGVDTIGYEIVEQLREATHVYVPAGGGGLAASVARGLAHRGSAASVIVCQPQGCAPIVRTLDGELPHPVVDLCETEISGLQIPMPPDGGLAVDLVAASGGWGRSISDREIFDAQRELSETEGVFVEPASATCLAAVRRDAEDGKLTPSDYPVIVLTGAGWKDLSRFRSSAGLAPVTVDEVTDQVARWVAA
ncbi:pyridoxal-phosphate dependent enzyme [Amycolatopsis sp. GM8]|uniref:threonine synthase n=1 Tax=Amycolatopsis sp. GM8 TaxID=2896530 RepID=UPI001F351ABA|nr:pyridoxal-phosphate dependent enzyme [Amycolatopsis sp. GM8]